MVLTWPKLLATFEFFWNGVAKFQNHVAKIWPLATIFQALVDETDRPEQVLDQRYIPDVSEKIFTHDISMIRRQKMVIFGVLKVFISNFTYYDLY